MNSKKLNNEGQFVKRAAKAQLGLWLTPQLRTAPWGLSPLGPGLRRQVVVRATIYTCDIYLCCL